MNMNNNLTLKGRLVYDVKLNTTSTGINVTTIRLAVENNFPSQNGEYETQFFNVTLWNHAALKADKMANKGDKVEISGSLKNNKENGKDNIEIVGNDILVLEKNKSHNQENNQEKNQEKELDEEFER